MAKKSVILTYILWLVGGIFGLHHVYLERDAQAFIWWCTLGGYVGFGWLRDIFHIPEYVAEANDDKKFVEKHVERVRTHETPPFSSTRFCGMVVIAYLWSSVFWMAIPEEPVGGISWRWLIIFVPLACALGVWTVGNIGKEEGTIHWALYGAYVTFPLYWYFDDDSTWYTVMTFVSALGFDTKGKQWRRKPKKQKSFMKRIAILSLCGMLYMSLWGSYFYFNAKFTDSEGEEIKLSEAINHFFTSPLWTDLKQSLHDTWIYAQHHGWYEIWKQLIDLSDPHGEQNAYKVLGLSSGATQQEITAKWRALSREFHPDKTKDPALKKAAQDKFMDIQQAYEILSNIKSKRNRRNKKYNPD
ncbi:hypothetical protein C0J52_06062 [Blattella germanica]|nr:hypothetical protein C0J52_06062 [Blattella germanica]